MLISCKKAGAFTSLHGTPEVEGDIWQLCAMKHYPDNYLLFLSCISIDYKFVPLNAEDCSAEAELDYNVLMVISTQSTKNLRLLIRFL